MDALARQKAGGQSLITTMTEQVKCRIKKVEQEPRLNQMLQQQFHETTNQSPLVMPKVGARVITPSNRTISEKGSNEKRQQRFESRTGRHIEKRHSTCSSLPEKINMKNETISCERPQFQKVTESAHRRLKMRVSKSRKPR